MIQKTNKAEPIQLHLSGLEGSNPLAFLAALGTLRAAECAFPTSRFRLGWRQSSGAWRPTLFGEEFEAEPETFCDGLSDYLSAPMQMGLFEDLGNNLTKSPEEFAKLCHNYLSRACDSDASAMVALQFLAAFGTDATHQPHSKDRTLMQDTALRTMSGAGHQHFIKFMREIIAETSSSHLYDTLLEPWKYEDEGRGMNLRWDPIDDRRYALRWKNPSSDPAMTMRGANRLAIEGLPFFSTAPMGNRLETKGFRINKGAFWSWPIWESPLKHDVIRSLLSFAPLSSKTMGDDHAQELRHRGIAAVYQSQRITVGKFRNFTPAKTVIG